MKYEKFHTKIDFVLKYTKNSFILIELEKGFTCNGKILKMDEFFNVLICDVIFTSKNGFVYKNLEKFFIRGKNIKTIRLL